MSLLIVSFVTFNFYKNFRSFIILKQRQRIAAAPAVFARSSGSGSAGTSLIQVEVVAAPLLFSSNSGSDSGATIEVATAQLCCMETNINDG